MTLVMTCSCSYPVDEFVVVDSKDAGARDTEVDALASRDSAPTPDTRTPADDTHPAVDSAPTCGGDTPDLCAGTCTNLKKDRKNCGACGKACQAGETCQAGGGGGATPECN